MDGLRACCLFSRVASSNTIRQTRFDDSPDSRLGNTLRRKKLQQKCARSNHAA